MESKKGALSSCFVGAEKCTYCLYLGLNSGIARVNNLGRVVERGDD